MTRSLFLKNESYSDVQAALAKADTEEERKRMMSDRAKANGWTKEKEIEYQKHLHACGFTTAFSEPKANTLAKNVNGGHQARLLRDAVRSQIRQSKIIGEVEK
jgi:hypothetical protein